MTDKKFTDEEITKAVECCSDSCPNFKTVEQIKAEAYKEFAEKLKNKCYEDFQETYEMLSPYVTDDDIDTLLKEMVGEEE